ncbi:unnamed protein product [Meloidogyne enterolobii]|uniref:Uncharacterized protein n=1 Tax=Meloidogyne enterolobii TaxID=390850 RepID=A0ACB0Y2S8_MELEN
MEKMVKELDDGGGNDWLITREKGEQLATMFGPDCQFKCFSFSALKAEQEAVEAEGLNDNTFILTIIDQLIKRAEDVKSGRSTKNNTNNSTNNHLRRRSNSPTNLNSRRLSPLSTNLKRMLQGGTNHLKGGGNAVVKLITKKKNNNTNEENNTTNNAAITNVENKKTSLGGVRRLFSRQKSEERNIPVKSGSTLSLPNSQQQQETQQQQPTENGKSNPPQSTSTSIFGNAYRAIITNPRERLKQRNNKIASTVPLAGNDGIK